MYTRPITTNLHDKYEYGITEEAMHYKQVHKPGISSCSLRLIQFAKLRLLKQVTFGDIPEHHVPLCHNVIVVPLGTGAREHHLVHVMKCTAAATGLDATIIAATVTHTCAQEKRHATTSNATAICTSAKPETL